MDFALWGPNNRRFQEKLKYSAQRYDPETQFHTRVEVHGPRAFEQWIKCWRVFENTCFLIGIVLAGPLQAYADLIRNFVNQYPASCWFIIYQAELLIRSESFERLRRHAQVAYDSLSQAEKDKSDINPNMLRNYSLKAASSSSNMRAFQYGHDEIHQTCLR